ncbi:class C sortase [Arcanobacterium pinnipediorum]|uniref:Class C sortase n=1 Tax=Arcanobacterium pinnipediorum TaxID=1503041 RepID=A0ABY5AH15_9ACTO|nr:class C sortase [Arcanobacterium pinnipediorum]USR79488.1 class C sortase [Arcanobacterium pinnipediorum]
MRRVYLGRIISSILAIIGFAVLLYPTAASWTNQYYQSKLIGLVHEQVKHVEPAAHEQIAQARRYNDALTSGARLAPNTNIPLGDIKQTESSLGLADYFDILNIQNSGIMGRILVPSADVDIPIYHGTDESTLLKGAGHLQGTSFPVGGVGTRSVITAHRGLASATMFTNLDRVELGDEFTLNIFDEVLVYRVIDVKVVAPEDSEQIKADPDRDLATLVTCTPLGINSHRILVTGERITPTPIENIEEASQDSSLPRFPWFAVFYTIFFIVALAIIIHSIYKLRKLKAANREETIDSSEPVA